MSRQEIWVRFYIELNLQGHEPATAARIAALKTNELLDQWDKIK